MSFPTYPPVFTDAVAARLRRLAGCAALLLLPALTAAAQSLQVGYGARGVASISYRGTTLESTAAFPGDSFHIWHMKATDLNGNPVSGGQYTWGENNNGEGWNADTGTETYSFTWGSIATRFVQQGDELDMIVTETNNPGSGIIFDGAEILPFALHFPQDPAGFSGYTQNLLTTRDPGVSVADFGSGVVTAVLPDESQPLYTGWKNVGANTYSPIMTSTLPDGSPSFLATSDRPVPPGASFSYTIALRFTPEGTAADAGDAYRSFAGTYPSQIHWTDRRLVGTAYLASSPSGSDITQPGGFPTNPRRWFNDASVDVTTPAGLQAFQNRILAQAASNAANARLLNAQGVITWDIEGEQYPQTTSYVCSPDQIAAVAPEMESVISDNSSPFFGQRLDDAYFKTMSGAGLRTGVCLRPQLFTLGGNGTAQQNDPGSNAQVVATLEGKARYANGRWGTTLFYVDSTVDSTGDPLDPAIFQQLSTDLPGFLFIPEESTTRDYAYTAPFYSFLFHGTTGTPASVYQAYPNAFGANLVNDVAAGTLAAAVPQLTAAVAHGDILMGHVDYWQENDPVLASIYAAAGVAPPAQTTPALAWPVPAAIPYGTALSASQLDATASVPGSFTYSPAVGTVLPAGTTTLSVLFTPADTAAYTTARATVPLTVGKAQPVLAWPVPAPIAAGTALSAAQLNATANVAGSFTYTPGAGTVPAAGSVALQATFVPDDATDYNTATVGTTLQVNAADTTAATAPLAILSPGAGSVLSGAVEVTGYVNLPLDAAGSFLMVDGVEVGTRRVTGGPYVYPLDTMTLPNGVHLLQLWAHDIGNNTTLSATVQITVQN